MTNPTDPRVEAAARAICRRESGYLYSKDKHQWENRSWGLYKERATDALKAADKAAWLPIESAPAGVNGIAWMQLAKIEGDETFTWSGMYIHGKFYAAGVFHKGGEVPYEFRQHEVHPTHWQPLPTPPENP